MGVRGAGWQRRGGLEGPRGRGAACPGVGLGVMAFSMLEIRLAC